MSGYAFAHPPGSVTLSYNDTGGELSVAVTHQVDDPTTHFVEHVTVRQGNTVLIDKSYSSQPGKTSFSYRYDLPQLKGSSGEVIADARCSITGSRSGTLTLSGTTAQGQSGSSTPAPTRAPLPSLLVLLGAGLVIIRATR